MFAEHIRPLRVAEPGAVLGVSGGDRGRARSCRSDYGLPRGDRLRPARDGRKRSQIDIEQPTRLHPRPRRHVRDAIVAAAELIGLGEAVLQAVEEANTFGPIARYAVILTLGCEIGIAHVVTPVT